jgi:His-Xaa-Ser repeat protein HxsA
MKDLKKFRRYTINSLLAAGILPIAAADEIGDQPKDTSMEDVKAIVNDISDQQRYTLAQHQSHSSHSSHSSHGSHQSYVGSVTLVDSSDLMQAAIVTSDAGPFSSQRNEQSTPRSSVLPSSPAISKTKKLKRLPGNSELFQATVRKAQMALIGHGYAVGNLEGELDARTIAAIYEYQSARGFIPTGKLTPDTLSSLNIVVQ